MKKLLILSTMAILSGCACFQSDDEEAVISNSEIVYRGIDEQGCNYLNDENCTRPKTKTYNQHQDYRQGDMYAHKSPRPRNNVVTYRDTEPQTVYNITVQERRPAPVPAPMPVMAPAPTPVPMPTPEAVPLTKTLASCGDIKTTSTESTLPDGTPCPAQIKETREPVEVIYKKTTYKTVYEPKTTSTVSYEKEAYKQGSIDLNSTTGATPGVVEQISASTVVEDIMPANEIK